MNNNKKISILIIILPLILFSFLNYNTLLHISLLFLSRAELFFIFNIVNVLISLLLFNQRKFTLMLLMMISIMVTYLNFSLGLVIPRMDLVIPSILTSQLTVSLSGIIVLLGVGYTSLCILLRTSDLSASEKFLAAIGLGFGVNMLLLILLAIFAKLTIANVIVAQFAILSITVLIILNRKKKQLYFNIKTFVRIVMKVSELNTGNVVLFAATVGYICFTLYPMMVTPITNWDSLAYGINYAKAIFDNNAIPLIAGPSIGKELGFNSPPGHQILVAWLFILANEPDDFYYKFLASVVIVGIVLAVYELSITLNGSRYQTFLAITITLTLLNLFQGGKEHYIIYLMLFSTLSMIYFLKALHLKLTDRKVNQFENTAALFCGFSGLINYHGMLMLIMVIAYSIVRRLSIQRITFLIFISLLIPLPWYLRNVFLLNNPVYPMLGFGNFLDSTLYASTLQHFRSYWPNIIGFLLEIITKGLFLIIGFSIVLLKIINSISLNVDKKQLLFLSLCLSSIPLIPFLLHAPFPRYFLVGIPFFSAIMAKMIASLITSRDWIENVASIMILLALMSLFIPLIAFYKPVIKFEDKMEYVRMYYGDAEAWKWINDNTRKNDTIATFDIREYYINRKVMLLDGYNASPLYKIKNISEAIEYLRQLGVGYILSVPWACPQSYIMPPAYEWLIITKYLGSSLLPPVYVSPNGAAVYSVKPIKDEKVYDFFKKENLVPPLKELKLNITISNVTQPSTGGIYIAIPCDYVGGQMHAWIAPLNKLVSIELRKGLIEIKARRSPLSIGLEAKNPGFVWDIHSGGYYTLLVVAREKDSRPFNVTLYIKFYNKWETNEMFLNTGRKALYLNITDYHVPSIEILYLNVKEPSILDVKSHSFGKRISLEIYEGLIPRNIVTNWWTWVKTVERAPTLAEGSGTKDPAINHLFLLPGYYSLLVVYWDTYDLKKSSILLEIELMKLSRG
jgi:hypothetical protein